MTAPTLRGQILELLRAHPDGIATLPLMERLGAERSALISVLGRMAQCGLVRATAGTAAASIWTIGPGPPLALAPAPSCRGAAELERARARSAAMAQARSQR